MERCATHGFLNCKCQETLSAYLARRFRESGSDYVDRGQLVDAPMGVADLGDRFLRGRHVGGETKR